MQSLNVRAKSFSHRADRKRTEVRKPFSVIPEVQPVARSAVESHAVVIV